MCVLVHVGRLERARVGDGGGLGIGHALSDEHESLLNEQIVLNFLIV